MKLVSRVVNMVLDLAAFGVGLKFDQFPGEKVACPSSSSPAPETPSPDRHPLSVGAGEPATAQGFVAYLRDMP